MPPTILTVCTGNICRSPAMELALREELGDDVRVHSAGTYGQENIDYGWGVPRETQAAMRAAGLDPTGHEPTQLTQELVEKAALVLVATAQHARWIARNAPGTEGHVFLLHEAVELAAGTPRPSGDTLGERVTGAAALLDGARGGSNAAQDVMDPWGHPARVHNEVVREIQIACVTLAGWLR